MEKKIKIKIKIKMKMKMKIKMKMKLTSSCPRGGRLMFLTLSRMICRIVFRKAFRNSDVLQHNDNMMMTTLIVMMSMTI